MQVLQTITGHNVSVPMVTVMRGMAKVFVGELVEAGKVPACLNLLPVLKELRSQSCLQLDSLLMSREIQVHCSLRIIVRHISSCICKARSHTKVLPRESGCDSIIQNPQCGLLYECFLVNKSSSLRAFSTKILQTSFDVCSCV